MFVLLLKFIANYSVNKTNLVILLIKKFNTPASVQVKLNLYTKHQTIFLIFLDCHKIFEKIANFFITNY